jgi:hypothetical protein
MKVSGEEIIVHACYWKPTGGESALHEEIKY